jgi:hypothetical protein
MQIRIKKYSAVDVPIIVEYNNLHRMRIMGSLAVGRKQRGIEPGIYDIHVGKLD